MPPERPDTAHADASILLWQSRYRLLLLAAVGSITLTLKWAGVLSSQSIVAPLIGAGTAVRYTAILAGLYFVFNGALVLHIRQHRRVDRWVVPAVLVMDIVTFHGAIFLSAPPEWYERALILSLFSIQLTLLYFGWRPAAWNLLGVVAGYLVMILLANELGSVIPLVESLWTLALFTLGVTVFLSLQADLGARMAMIVQIFDRAREGNLSIPGDDEPETRPDRLTVVGAAYDQMRRQLTSVILTDPLTQCFNGRGFEQMAARELARAVRQDAPLAILALDIDHFKKVNDTFGHLIGDDVLRDIGVILRQTARVSDVVARTGGEEFTILAPDTDDEGAAHLSTRIRTALAAHGFSMLQGRTVTMSIGYASASARTDDVVRLLRVRADEALYVAKRAGRDRAERWRVGLTAA